MQLPQEAVRATEVKSHPEQTIFPRHPFKDRFEMASQKIAFVLFTLVIISGLLTTMTDAFSSQTNMWQGKRAEMGQVRVLCVFVLVLFNVFD